MTVTRGNRLLASWSRSLLFSGFVKNCETSAAGIQSGRTHLPSEPRIKPGLNQFAVDSRGDVLVSNKHRLPQNVVPGLGIPSRLSSIDTAYVASAAMHHPTKPFVKTRRPVKLCAWKERSTPSKLLKKRAWEQRLVRPLPRLREFGRVWTHHHRVYVETRVNVRSFCAAPGPPRSYD